ncbi:Protein of unknown function [Reichenbachiella faecimaris]|uniref:DUF4197 domain-containing protein n=1 Tax=Reichenbachiella faecimaris TaxID=692418 RepID=A0A1W2G5K8_REIFA|nr:DUF4197 domain-containing protein [Reichenbachiella faecimaris]SMD31883.1 Protein of unknown function [Reichenbachiella faecimaris]
MKLTKGIIAISILLSAIGCAELKTILDQNLGLSNEEIVAGLKEALNIGLDKSVTSASTVNGYLKNEAIMLILPQEVKSLQQEINAGSVSLLNGAVKVSYKKMLDTYVSVNPNLNSDPFDELVIAMNRGAEQAAKKAVPIFGEAISTMSFSDALGILKGGEQSATDYFYTKTKANLQSAFRPEIKQALNNTHATEIYGSVADFVNYEYEVNYLINSYTIKTRDYLKSEKLPATLDGYATDKAIDGLFYLIGNEEKKIRANPMDYTSAIIKKVFSSDEAQGN